MHNMSEEYYKYLCDRLVTWANNTDITRGDRFSLILEEQKQVAQLMDSLKENELVSDFQIEEKHSGLKTIAIEVKKTGMKLVVVSTINVEPAYLVMLRNRIGSQDGNWDNTAILFISNKTLDSIMSGAKDLSRQGGPFNLNELRKNLGNEIVASNKLSSSSKSILQAMVKTVFDSQENYTLMDFADVYSVIEKGDIAKADYRSMGYFYDNDIASYPTNKIQQRLSENHADFANIEQSHGFGDIESKISKMVAGDSLVKELSSDDWEATDYSKIIQGKDALQNDKKVKVNFLPDDLKAINSSFVIWDRAERETAAGFRKRQIVIFNDQLKDNLEILLPFDQSVRTSGVNNRNTNLSFKSSGYKLVVNILGLPSDNATSVKFTYDAKPNSSMKYTFSILVLPFSAEVLSDIQSSYELKLTGSDFKIQLPSDITDIHLGTSDNINKINAHDVSDINGEVVDEQTSLSIKLDELQFVDDSEDEFNISVFGVDIKFSLIDEEMKITPKNALYFESYRRQHQVDGSYADEKITFFEKSSSVFGSQKPFLEFEKMALQTNNVFGDKELKLSPELTALYQQLFDTLNRRQTLMSLVNWDSEIRKNVEMIVEQVQSEIKDTTEKIEPNKTVSNIARIGELEIDGSLAFAPFNPILLSYQYQVETEVGNENLSETIQRSLNPDHLVPFLQRDGRNYKSFFSSDAPRWLMYSESKLSKFSEVSQTIVTERLKDFHKHFEYLFNINPETTYNVRIEGVNDEKAIIKSVSDYLCSEIEDKLKKNLDPKRINPVNVYMARDNHQEMDSEFNAFYQLKSLDDYEKFFSAPLVIKNANNEQTMDFVDIIKDKINVFYQPSDDISYHITFYQFSNRLSLVPYSSEELNMNYSMNGLIGGDEYTTVQGSIKDGFGTKDLGQTRPYEILDFAKSWNELLVATINEDASMYHGQTLVNNVKELAKEEFQSQFDKSKWVTLLTPEVKLDYFNKMSQDIYVIHYTDYTNSANYESITLTKEVEQYENILSENLPTSVSYSTDEVFLKNIIKSFNIINGQWLLRLVSHSGQYLTVKEKLSILAVYKEMLGILQSKNVIWIPLSLEEILRVSGSFVGESRDSVFSAKSLNARGKISDDLLFIGLWNQDDELQVTFLPTEVKVGINSSGVINKANIQVEKTYSVFEDAVFGQDSFESNFYLDFFMKLYFANAAKLYSNDEMDKATYEILQKLRAYVNRGKIQINNSLTDAYRNKFVFSLKKDNNHRIIRFLDNYSLVEVPEEDAFLYSGISTQKIINKLQEGKIGFDPSRLLKNIVQQETVPENENQDAIESDKTDDQPKSQTDYGNSNEIHESMATSGDISDEFNGTQDSQNHDVNSGHGEDNSNYHDTSDTQEIREEYQDQSDNEIDDANDDSENNESNVKSSDDYRTDFQSRIMLGTIDGSVNKSYWEYGNPQLANRHMLITGKSGQGKTYFIQTLLLEFAKNKIDTLVIDYTDSYLPGQLDPLLEQNATINQHIVVQEKLPINPFKPQDIIIGSFHSPEKTENVVARVVQVVDFVFNLVVQQRAKLSQYLNAGLKGTPNYTFSDLKAQLLDDKDGTTLYGRLQPLLDNDPFTYGDTDFDWSKYFGSDGKINIIQLSSFPALVKNAIIEFILWDLFNYSQTSAHKHLTFPVFLDEIQNLNFSGETPTVKILREGRKFGWSGIFATQAISSIKGEVDAIYNAAEQIHFLPPENQTKLIARTLSSEKSQQALFEQQLSNLRKGQCIINGPSLTDNGQLKKQANVVNIDDLSSRL